MKQIIERAAGWTETRVAPCGTHHLHNGKSAYEARFDQVLKFHAPGLAPVQRGDDAWHILADGSAAYTRRFHRCFGFYEHLAAVIGDDGWHHITPDGEAAYHSRFDWCGNFQNNLCTVRGDDGFYLHITTDGEPAYDECWHYAGDFRDGIAVVQAAHGRATHINTDGRHLHEKWFLDLDVFHKDFARARDEGGWCHIDSAGNPAYQHRFAAVEPFYNGQARVERFDGALAIIDENGITIAVLRDPTESDFTALSADMTGFWRTRTIYAAVTLGIFEHLPASTTEIAAHCQLSPDRATRLLRALGELMLVELMLVEGDEAGWQATPRGACLQAGHPLTLADAAIEYAVHFPRLWESLPCALQTDGEQPDNWSVPDIFAEVEYDRTRLITHHRMLQSYALHDYIHVPEALGLRGDERVLDAGGGTGILAQLLLETCPGLDMSVMDRAGVMLHAERLRVQNHGEKATPVFVAGDLFSPWPVTADVVLLARVLHDWDDEDATDILHHARAALGPAGRLFIIEMLLPEDNHAGGLCDLHLLMVTGGRERTFTQYRRLLEAAAFEVRARHHLSALPSIIEAVTI